MTVSQLTGTETPTEVGKKINEIIDQKVSKDLDDLSQAGQAIIDGKVSSSDLYDNDGHIKINKLQSYSLPSDSYEELTLGASGTYYTAPADGYFVIAKNPTANGQSLFFYNHTTHFGLGGGCYGTELVRRIFPAKKNDEVEVGYTLAGSTFQFRFYYAAGSEPA